MKHTPIKRGRYLLGDKWKATDGNEWRIYKIADSELGSVLKLKSGFKSLVLSKESTDNFLRFKL